MQTRPGELIPLSEFSVQVGAVRSLGAMAAGERRVVAITGGEASGVLAGRIREGGADWQWLQADGITQISARYVIDTDCGGCVEVESEGVRHGPPEVMARVARGEGVPAEAYYFRTAIRLRTAHPPLAWLNGVLAVGLGERRADRVLLRVLQVG